MEGIVWESVWVAVGFVIFVALVFILIYYVIDKTFCDNQHFPQHLIVMFIVRLKTLPR